MSAWKRKLFIYETRFTNLPLANYSFTNGKTKPVDFLPLFHKYVKGENVIYLSPREFKKFIVKNGNIYWGKNEDVIFPADLLLKEKLKKITEEILYIS